MSLFGRFKKCQHGVLGAVEDIRKCSSCHSLYLEEARKRREQEQREDEERQALQAKITARYAALISDQDYLARMNPLEFESLCLKVYRAQGFTAVGTARTGDHGADGILTKDGETYILQAKRIRGSIGEPVLRDLLGTMAHFNAAKGILVTTGSLTKQAAEWVVGKPIEIVDLAVLSRMIGLCLHTGQQIEAYIPPVSARLKHRIHNPKKYCPNCNNKLVARKGPSGQFIGCTGFPKCRYTRRMW